MLQILEKIRIYGFKKAFLYVFNEIYRKYILQLLFNSYSQLGEDVFIDKYFGGKSNGYYVDVGAYDPDRFSNTKRFYQKGWRGINVEPNYNNFKKFLVSRSEDININVGVGLEEKTSIFYDFFPDTLSTFSQTEARENILNGFILREKRKVKVNKLEKILNQYSKRKSIDFLSIDTEGYDYQVLQSNNWRKYKPKLICVEKGKPIGNGINIQYSKIRKYLLKLKYKAIYITQVNAIFERE